MMSSQQVNPSGDLRHLRLVGSPRERGQQHGEALGREIRALYQQWLSCAGRLVPPLNEAELLAFTGRHLAIANAWAPAWIDEVEGIGEASGLGTERAFVLSCWDELCSWFAVRSREAASAGCTSFAVTGNSKVIIGQNQDAWGWWRPVVVLEEQDSIGLVPSTICASHPGVLGTLGVNAYGIGLVANSLVPADRDVGVPFAIVMREALRQSNLAAALGVILTAPRATGANFVLADEQQAVDIEATHSQAHVSYVTDVFAHSNHYLHDRFAPSDLGAPLLPDSYLREGRMRSLLTAAGDPKTVEVLARCLSDHDGAPTGICRHPPGHLDDMETLGASIIVPAEAALYISDGRPCSGEFSRFTAEFRTTSSASPISVEA